MGFYIKPYVWAMDNFLEWLFADKRKRKMLKYVPYYCRCCDYVAECRDENNNWKCRNGCWAMKK